jgi:hypothetical protein
MTTESKTSQAEAIKPWTEVLKEEYENGASDVEVCRALKITTARFEEMMREDPRFKKLVQYGRTLSQAWWMNLARTALYNKSFNSSMWAMVMKNRFGWSEKATPETDIPDNQRNMEEVRDQMKKLLPRILKEFSPELTDAALLGETKRE